MSGAEVTSCFRKPSIELQTELIPLTRGMVEFRVHVHLKTDLQRMHEIDCFVPWSIIQLQLLDRSLTPVLLIEYVGAERRLQTASSTTARLVEHALVTVVLGHYF